MKSRKFRGCAFLNYICARNPHQSHEFEGLRSSPKNPHPAPVIHRASPKHRPGRTKKYLSGQIRTQHTLRSTEPSGRQMRYQYPRTTVSREPQSHPTPEAALRNPHPKSPRAGGQVSRLIRTATAANCLDAMRKSLLSRESASRCEWEGLLDNWRLHYVDSPRKTSPFDFDFIS